MGVTCFPEVIFRAIVDLPPPLFLTTINFMKTAINIVQVYAHNKQNIEQKWKLDARPSTEMKIYCPTMNMNDRGDCSCIIYCCVLLSKILVWYRFLRSVDI